MRLHHDAWSWYQGALGEIQVGQLLSSLGPAWRVLHSVPIGTEHTDVDHILVGPNGVFVLNTKHHSGASIWVGDFVLKVNNSTTHHLKYARSENQKVAQRLASKVGFPVEVDSAIVMVGQRSIKDSRTRESREIAVLSSIDLVQWLRAHSTTMTGTELTLIQLAAEEPDTWHVDPHRADSLRVMQRFSRLQDAVDKDAPRPKAPEPVRERAQVVATSAPSEPSRRTPPARRTSPARRMTSAQKKRSDRKVEKLAEAIVAGGFAALMLWMLISGMWLPFMTGLIALLAPAP